MEKIYVSLGVNLMAHNQIDSIQWLKYEFLIKGKFVFGVFSFRVFPSTVCSHEEAKNSKYQNPATNLSSAYPGIC